MSGLSLDTLTSGLSLSLSHARIQKKLSQNPREMETKGGGEGDREREHRALLGSSDEMAIIK